MCAAGESRSESTFFQITLLSFEPFALIPPHEICRLHKDPETCFITDADTETDTRASAPRTHAHTHTHTHTDTHLSVCKSDRQTDTVRQKGGGEGALLLTHTHTRALCEGEREKGESHVTKSTFSSGRPEWTR